MFYLFGCKFVIFDIISLDISDKVRLFDSMVLPILCYGSLVWEFQKAVDIERVHTIFLNNYCQLDNKLVMYVCMVRQVVFRYIFTDKLE